MRALVRRATAKFGDPPPYGVALIGLTLLAFAVRVPYLAQPMRFDESLTYLMFASQPLSESLAIYSDPNNHLLHTLLVHLSAKIFGGDPWALRLPAFVAGVLMVPAAYAATKAFFRSHAALLAAGLVAASLSFIEFSTNARGYTILFLVFLILVAMVPTLARSDRKAPWLVFAALTALGFWTVPSMLLPFGVIALLIPLVAWDAGGPSRRNKATLDLIIYSGLAGLVTLVLYLPSIRRSGLSAITSNQYVTPLSTSSFFDGFPTWIRATFGFWNRGIPVVVQILVVLAFVVGVAATGRFSRWRIPTAVVAAAWTLAFVVARRVLVPPRVTLFLLLIYFATAASVLTAWVAQDEKRRPRLTAVALAVVAIATALGISVLASGGVLSSKQTGTLRDAERIARFLDGYLRPGDVVVTTIPSTAPLEYYLGRQGDRATVVVDAGRPSARIDAARIVLVVNLYHQKTLEGELLLLRRAGVAIGSEFGPPREIERYPLAVVYEIVRL